MKSGFFITLPRKHNYLSIREVNFTVNNVSKLQFSLAIFSWLKPRNVPKNRSKFPCY